MAKQDHEAPRYPTDPERQFTLAEMAVVKRDYYEILGGELWQTES